MFHDETMPSFFRRPSFSPDGSLLLVPGRKLKDTKNQQKYLYVTKDTSVKAYKSYPVAKKFHSPFPLHHICVWNLCTYHVHCYFITCLDWQLDALTLATRWSIQLMSSPEHHQTSELKLFHCIYSRFAQESRIANRVENRDSQRTVNLLLNGNVAACVVNKTPKGLNHVPPYQWVFQMAGKKTIGHWSELY